MNFDLPDLRAFVAVAKLGSFRAAAEELHLSQPALSRRIEKLEGALGVRLFHRTTRKVDMTTVGREFSHRANELLSNLEQSLMGAARLHPGHQQRVHPLGHRRRRVFRHDPPSASRAWSNRMCARSSGSVEVFASFRAFCTSGCWALTSSIGLDSGTSGRPA
jgi:molybdenum-dependent DNA-binding transcriptional regulator ModE